MVDVEDTAQAGEDAELKCSGWRSCEVSLRWDAVALAAVGKWQLRWAARIQGRGGATATRTCLSTQARTSHLPMPLLEVLAIRFQLHL